MIFFSIDQWARVVVILILTPIYFLVILWLIITEARNRIEIKEKIKKVEKIKEGQDQEEGKDKMKDLDVKVRLVYNSIKKLLRESDRFSIKELATMLDIKYEEVNQIIKNLIQENIFKGKIKRGEFYRKNQ
ncbi:MAG: hypothetical protein GF329_17335 [Candidatus Lokiarchaeota archaeon]|nr:hypothetical protein [Candidatus Lokiarchaeota archaeon]